MKLDLTSKLASVGLELSKANTEKLEQALDTVLAEFRAEMQAEITPKIEAGKHQLDEAIAASLITSKEIATRLSRDAETSSKSFGTSLESYRDYARKMNSTVETLAEKVRTLQHDLDQKSETIHVNTQSRRVAGVILATGVVIGVALVLLGGSLMASRAQERAVQAQEREKRHLATLEAFQRLYGVSLAMSLDGTPLFDLPPGKKLVSTKGLFDMLDRTNRWRVN
jgi:hypothetical protein